MLLRACQTGGTKVIVPLTNVWNHSNISISTKDPTNQSVTFRVDFTSVDNASLRSYMLKPRDILLDLVGEIIDTCLEENLVKVEPGTSVEFLTSPTGSMSCEPLYVKIDDASKEGEIQLTVTQQDQPIATFGFEGTMNIL